MALIWTFISPYALSAVTWAMWIFTFLLNALLAVYSSHKSESILTVLVGLWLWSHHTPFAIGLLAGIVWFAGYIGSKLGTS